VDQAVIALLALAAGRREGQSGVDQAVMDTCFDAGDAVLFVIALLALTAGLYLLRKAWRTREWVIVSAALPRLYIAGLYLLLMVTNFECEVSRPYVRAGLIVLFLIENFNHLLEWLWRSRHGQ
jgi:hypothetical protein